MILNKYKIEFITPCICGGAEPEERAEIRIPSIRGQLRWWFRVLGGFKILSEDVREQEDMIFGSTTNNPSASKLILRLSSPSNILSEKMNGTDLGADRAYRASVPFPLRQQKDRRVIKKNTAFELSIFWKGRKEPFQKTDELKESIDVLISIWVSLGGLGFMSRKGFGALTFSRESYPPHDLKTALSFFKHPENILIKKLNNDTFTDSNSARVSLWKWYKTTRAYKYKEYIKNDREAGLAIANNNKWEGKVYRPALGLPIIQHFSKRNIKNNINWYPRPDSKGRFASPILLRPFKSIKGYLALVIFIEALKWPENKKVYINSIGTEVSLDLYNKIKNDSQLSEFNFL
ncbi:hypothetical protein A946_02025 [Methylacidiphilum kamchatkense Kam1]|uniref:CRISPR type III-B/RAMP module RAMP protein Cmr1 n=1 Tax=Methylacidiphilum kamchatkense Kam1 TaxID=1202785 RepID=A0A0C1RX18_9BACT|nr:type III-B CRISPR module RAMP protein Cmr1 [Methylacidiphilum kamchatkense]KIE59471.1 hypothetical protein A946_02025 [Methylacidiphilum kamchatkense Kam1]QDQ42530.1 CRISPR type III-B/RAMP module RAMP protein Cmr1 [Methylacidiphilum kamchatkense Kam1]